MRLTAIEFSGYPAGVTDFETLIETTAQPGLGQLESALSRVANQVVAAEPNRVTSLITVGHSDRQDRADLDCNQRRSTEIQAAQDRAVSAWEWMKQRVTDQVALAGFDAGEWWEDDAHVSWGLVFAATGMLKFPDPASEDERLANRRVVVLVTEFDPE